jgi:hypothetical protein
VGALTLFKISDNVISFLNEGRLEAIEESEMRRERGEKFI